MFEPAHDSAASGGSSLEKPFVRDDVVAEDQSWIGFVFVHADAHSACLSALFLGFARVDDSCTEGSARCIQTSGYNRCSFCKSALLCSFGSNRADYVVTIADLRKEIHRDSETLTHFFVPAAFAHVETVKAVTLRYILGDSVCQLECDVAVGLKDLVDICINFRQIFFVPDDFCCCIGWLE